MAESFKQFGLRAISGEERSAAGGIVRAATAIAEPIYSDVMAARNFCYDHGLFHTQDLGRPTISVGNITTGGTGKTPVVQWLAGQLQLHGYHPAILLRGYGNRTFSDEAELLQKALKNTPVQADPSRISGAAQVLKTHSEVDVFVLDDAFQHRKARRDFNLVLISATNPFGYGHVLPRGLLREPVVGLKRADAFLITRSSLVAESELLKIDRYLSEHHSTIPIYHCDHQFSGVWMTKTDETISPELLANQSVFLTAGIGDPAAFAAQIASLGGNIVGTKWFDDHHVFAQSDIDEMLSKAALAKASQILTTEKDWVKMSKLYSVGSNDLAIGVMKLSIAFRADNANQLLQKIITSAKKGCTVEG